MCVGVCKCFDRHTLYSKVRYSMFQCFSSPHFEPLVVAVPQIPFQTWLWMTSVRFFCLSLFERFGLFPQSPQDYIGDYDSICKAHRECEEGKRGNFDKAGPNSQPTSPKGGQSQGSTMFMLTLEQANWLGNHGKGTVCVHVSGLVGWSSHVCESTLCIFI